MRFLGFGSRHHILEMATIPRQRDALRQALGQARAAKRKSNLSRWAAINLLAWSLIAPMWISSSRAGQASTVVQSQPLSPSVFIPLVIVER